MDHIVEKLKKQIVQAMLFFFFSLCTPLLAFATTTVPSGVLTGTTTWTAAQSPYIVSYVQIPPDAALTIEPGTIVKIAPSGAFDIYGALTIGDEGSTTEVFITSLLDDTIGGDTNGDATSTIPQRGDWFGMNVLYTSPHASIHHTTFRYGSGPLFRYGMLNDLGANLTITDSTLTDAQYYAFYQTGGTTTISNTTFARAPIGIYHEGGISTITDSSFTDTPQFGIWNVAPTPIDAVNNWWGHASGPYHSVLNPSGAGTHINGDIRFVPWLAAAPGTTTPLCVTECYSNVLFLPGIMGSTLYRYDPVSGASTKVWEPGLGHTGTEQVEQLLMNPELGTSNNSDIYAKEILKEDWSGSNYYKTFAEAMDQISGEGKSINEWEGVPYDWRLAPEDIVTKGKKDGAYISYLQSTSTPYIIQELRRLAANSKTGKVTIVAHSYGGLVTKALVDTLGTTTAQGLIDNIVFVAVPQVGTPQAIAGMLYGKNQDLGFGFAVTEAEAQSLAATLPMAYTLLPSRGYFSSVHEQVVSLPLESHFAPWRSVYGSVVGNWDELHSFLTSASDRDMLQNLLVSSGIPPLLNHAAHMRALATHNTVDPWTPPKGIMLTQIAGWGIPKTVKGVTFDAKLTQYCAATDVVCQDTTPWKLIPGYDTTMDGDGTVVTPSALWTSTMSGAVDYWVDLGDYNDQHWLVTALGLFGIKHADILEVPELTSFITDLLTQSTKPLPEYTYLSNTVPVDTNPRLRYTLHSPLTLDLYDDQGRHTGVSTTTGEIEEQIPGTYFSQFGEVKYLFTDASTTGHIVLDGYATGTFTFSAEELQDDTLLASTTWKDIPTTPDTKVTITAPSGASSIEPMNIDVNGDGVIDITLPSKLNDVVTLPTPKLPLTVTANNKIILLGSTIPPLTATLLGFQGGDTATSSTSGTPICTTTATATSTVGNYPITCAIGSLTSSKYDFTTFTPGTLTLQYKWAGFGQPINDTAYNPTQTLSVFKSGSTIPVKFQLKNASGTSVQASTSPLWLTPQQGSAMSVPVGESVYSDPATSGTTFKWDVTSQQYIYNWSTKGLATGFWYRIYAKLEDGTTQSVTVGIR